ncbi:hypothetical protein BC834DRAFT_894613 [Gloeopeniophorella convolvens]|nr:hypothetical protein BC834DRAFT_894613 [Gloeopeniophorella convolvens]
MNFTLDDASGLLTYSSAWESQPNNDPYLSSFFQSTYHAALSDGASVNFSFSGSAVFVYGSTGPQHAQFSVFFDEFVQDLTAETNETEFRQLLFSHTFENNSAPHIVSIVAHPTIESPWFDLDFITFTQDTNRTVSSTPTPASPTILPPWSAQTSSLAVPVTASSKSTRSSARPTTIAAITLGAVLGIVLLALLVVFLLAWRRGRGFARVRDPALAPQSASTVRGWSINSPSSATRLSEVAEPRHPPLPPPPRPRRTGPLLSPFMFAATRTSERRDDDSLRTDFLKV